MFRSITQFSILVLFSLTSVVFFSTQSYAAEKKTQNQTQIATLTVNINKASAEEIADVLTGVGLNKAKTIVAYREKTGNFKSIDDLLSVKGIGAATLKKNRHKVKL